MPHTRDMQYVVYQAKVKNSLGGQATYVGLAQNFKERFRKHRKNLKEKSEEGKITLYTHFWKEKEEGRNPTVEWKILEKNVPLFNPVNGICRLCTREKFNILLNPNQATLNSRQEIFSNCKHKEAKLIGRPPGWKVKGFNPCIIITIFCCQFMSVWGLGYFHCTAMKLIVTV